MRGSKDEKESIGLKFLAIELDRDEVPSSIEIECFERYSAISDSAGMGIETGFDDDCPLLGSMPCFSSSTESADEPSREGRVDEYVTYRCYSSPPSGLSFSSCRTLCRERRRSYLSLLRLSFSSSFFASRLAWNVPHRCYVLLLSFHVFSFTSLSRLK